MELIKEKKKRTSKTNQEYKEKKAIIITEKLQNPDITIMELQKKYGVAKSVIGRELKKEFREIGEKKIEIVEIAKENVLNGNKIIREYINNMKASDLKTQSDLNLFTSSIKNQQSLVSMIENYSQGNQTTNIIPVNIQVNIK